MPWNLDRGRRAGEMGYLPGLDGLRAIAIIGVLLYHAGIDWFPGGFLGVDVFFVLSGFLITSLILEEYERAGRVDFKTFYIRRARRLLPAVIVMLIGVGIAVLIFYRDALSAFREDALATVLYLNNWWYIAVDQSYFESMGRPPLLKHLWSLAVEEQFYLIWPAIAVLLMRRGNRALVRRIAMVLAVASTAWMAVLAIRGGFPIDADPSRAYFGTDSHSMGLLVGAALATVWRPGRLRSSVSSGATVLITAAGVAMLAVVIGFYTLVGEFTPWLYRGGFLVLALATAALIAAATHPASPLGPILGIGLLRYLGRRSYGIYLWHWPIFMVTRPGIDVPWNDLFTFVVRVAITLVIAEISYRLVEMPIRQGVLGEAWRRARTGARKSLRTVATLGAAAMTVILAIAVAIALVLSPGDGRDAIPADIAEAMGILDGGPLEVSIEDQIPTEPASVVSVEADEPPEPTIEEIRAENGPVSVLGDSVVLGARSAITEAIPGARVDAEVSRMPGAFTGRVKRLDRRDKLANIVVLHPATNGVLTEEILRNTLDPLSNYERVVLVNASVPRSWERPNNAIIRNVLPDYPNVILADWNSLAAGKREFFVSDGVHLTRQGATAFAGLIKDSAGL
jgi:peptidoglycan/LPS O-acetylase OafA/YrhL